MRARDMQPDSHLIIGALTAALEAQLPPQVVPPLTGSPHGDASGAGTLEGAWHATRGQDPRPLAGGWVEKVGVRGPACHTEARSKAPCESRGGWLAQPGYRPGPRSRAVQALPKRRPIRSPETKPLRPPAREWPKAQPATVRVAGRANYYCSPKAVSQRPAAGAESLRSARPHGASALGRRREAGWYRRCRAAR